MNESIVDVRFNRYEATELYYADNLRPSLNYFDDYGIEPINTDLEVLIGVNDKRYEYEKLAEIEDWLERTNFEFKQYGRYLISEATFETHKKLIGLVFVFLTKRQMAAFMTTFGSSTDFSG